MANNPEDEAAIVALIHANRIAMWTQDFAAYENCFLHSPALTRWNASRFGGIFIRKGWEDIAQRVQLQFADKSFYFPAFAHETRVENLQLRIGVDMAWATFEQHYPAPAPGHNGPAVTHEARFFEKHDGQWRIAFLGFLDYNAGRANAPILRLGPDGAVQWTSPEAVTALEADDDLVVRAGRLRVRDSRTDQKLQAAIRWAGQHDKILVPTRGALPIVLEAGEGLPTKVWWVIAESGMILFLVGDPGLNAQRMDMAAVVYGLSPAQKRLAALVAEGLALNEIAARMEVTPNTARTHLNRVFEKTGVRTQPALVRVLLSAAAPI